MRQSVGARTAFMIKWNEHEKKEEEHINKSMDLLCLDAWINERLNKHITEALKEWIN